MSIQYLVPRIKKKILRIYIPRAQKLQDLVIFFMVTFGVFLPVRWFFYGEVTHHLLPNMGVITAIAIIMFLLIRAGKLGFIGRGFERQMMRFVASRTFKRILIFSLALSLYTGIPILFIERGEFVWNDELEMFEAISIRSAYLRTYILDNTEPLDPNNPNSAYMTITDFCKDRPLECIIDPDDIEYEEYQFVMLSNVLPSDEIWEKVNNMGLMESFEYNSDLADNWDFLFSTAMHLANIQSDGWTGHFSTVWFVEEIEAVGLYFLYRRWYLKKSNSAPWLGIFDKKLKLIMYKTEKKDRFYKGRNTKHEDKNSVIMGFMVSFIAGALIFGGFRYDIPLISYGGLGILGVTIIAIVLSQRKRKNRLK